MTKNVTDHACAFRRMHQHGLLTLPNAWDAGSARLIEMMGAPAIATTSGGVAWSHGYADGVDLPLPRLLASVEAICRAVQVPVTVDLENGYAHEPAAVGRNVAAVIDKGAVGINLEDGSDSPDRLCAKIMQARRAAVNCGIDVFINARTDVILRGLAHGDEAIDEIVARAARYRDAGADGLFVPGLVEPEAIARVVAEVALPLNLLARPGLPDTDGLKKLGVRRLSAGSTLLECLYGQLATMARSFIDRGCLPQPSNGFDYARLNELFQQAA